MRVREWNGWALLVLPTCGLCGAFIASKAMMLVDCFTVVLVASIPLLPIWAAARLKHFVCQTVRGRVGGVSAAMQV